MNCPYCGKETDPQHPFCMHCGSSMPQAQQPAQASAQGAAPAPPPGMGQPVGGQPGQPPADATVVIPPQAAGGPAQYPAQAAPPPQQYAPQAPYAQPTMQIPGAPVPGTYQQPAYGQGPYAPQPPVGYPQGPYSQMQPYTQPYAAARRGSTLLGILTMIAGGAVVGSTFLAWLTASFSGFGSASLSGLKIMTGGLSGTGSSINFVLTGDGIFFTGFFALLLGTLMMIGGIIMLFRRRIGGALAFIFAIAAAGMAAVNIAMLYAKIPGAAPGVGLWLFGGASLAALVFGFVGLVSSSG
jgi:hypothetical protein